MDDLICYCPVCNGQLLFKDLEAVGDARTAVTLTSEKLYCPRCEIMIEPVVASVDALRGADPAYRDDPPPEQGRAAAAGSNAGCSQRGDLSDQGASQWRTDPSEAGRNTWQPKD